MGCKYFHSCGRTKCFHFLGFAMNVSLKSLLAHHVEKCKMCNRTLTLLLGIYTIIVLCCIVDYFKGKSHFDYC